MDKFSKTLENFCDELKPKIFSDKFKYPGRGIIVGCNSKGHPVIAYFIMGRSESSRARIFERSKDDLIIKLTNNDKNFDSSLILYSPLKVLDDKIIITNGDQTDTIFDELKNGGSFESALRTREYEPDSPHYTPRISAILEKNNFKISILKKDGRYFFEYELIKGEGRLIHTYNHDVMPNDKLPSFEGEPRKIKISDEIEDFSNDLWNELDEKNKVALYVRFYEPDYKNYQDRLFNAKEYSI